MAARAITDGLFEIARRRHASRSSAATRPRAGASTSRSSTRARTPARPTSRRVTLSADATLWAWTAVTAAPPGYAGPVPFGFGVVELVHEQLRVITRLTEPDPGTLAFGQPMRLVADDLAARERRARDHLGVRGALVTTRVEVAGVGIHPFGRFDGLTNTDMGVHAVRAALTEAGDPRSTPRSAAPRTAASRRGTRCSARSRAPACRSSTWRPAARAAAPRCSSRRARSAPASTTACSCSASRRCRRASSGRRSSSRGARRPGSRPRPRTSRCAPNACCARPGSPRSTSPRSS